MQFTTIVDPRKFSMPDGCVAIRISKLPDGALKNDALMMQKVNVESGAPMPNYVVLRQEDAMDLGLDKRTFWRRLGRWTR